MNFQNNLFGLGNFKFINSRVVPPFQETIEEIIIFYKQFLNFIINIIKNKN
jgi:hypothetical protein